MSPRTTATHARPPHVPFEELAGSWTLTMVVDVTGKVRASIGRLDLVTRKMRWSVVGERQVGSDTAPVPLTAVVVAAEIVMADAAAALKMY